MTSENDENIHHSVDSSLDAGLQMVDAFESEYNRQNRLRGIVGLGFVAAASTAAVVVGSGVLDKSHLGYDVPFNEGVQNVLTHIDDGLSVAGAISFPLALAGIGIVKVRARSSQPTQSIDRRSSQELSDDGKRVGTIRKGLRATVAGGVPIIASGGVLLGSLTTAIGTEITDGPTRPIRAFGEQMPGNIYLVQHEGAMPMQDSYVSRDLIDSVTSIAADRNITTRSLDRGLGDITFNGHTRTALFLGLQNPIEPIKWDSSSCQNIPVLVDETAGTKVGDTIKLNDTPAVVAGLSKDISAINRVGVVIDADAMAACHKKNANHPYHLTSLDTDLQTGRDILKQANINGEIATVISEDRYIQNSEKFWRSNVKPITNLLALVSGGVALLSMSGIMASRLIRNRREWAAKLASGESDAHMRSTEMLRGAKDGVMASVVGTALATATTPLTGLTESGMFAAVGYKEMTVGWAVGTIGSVFGSAIRVLRPRKVIKPNEYTR